MEHTFTLLTADKYDCALLICCHSFGFLLLGMLTQDICDATFSLLTHMQHTAIPLAHGRWPTCQPHDVVITCSLVSL